MLHSAIAASYAPGTTTALLLCFPLSLFLIRRTLPDCRPRDLRLGGALGILSFPPLVHAFVLIVLGAARVVGG